MSNHHAPIIGYHRAPLSQKFGAPRQPNLVALMSVIEMVAPYDVPEAFVGLADFSHIWLSWQFHHNYLNQENSLNQENAMNKNAKSNDTGSNHAKADSKFRPQVRPPRLGGNQKVGVFASRSTYRPSGLGLSVVKLERIEVIEGRVLLTISGADMIDGTPIIDIKPYIAYSDAFIDANSGFASAKLVPLNVTITPSAREQFMTLVQEERFDKGAGNNAGNRNNDNDKKSNANSGTKSAAKTSALIIYKVQKRLLASDIDNIKALIAYDPRPAYRRDEMNASFTMRYKSVDISFEQVEPEQLQITAVVDVD